VPTRRILRSAGGRRSRLAGAALAAAPRPKIAAGLLAYAILQVAAHFGVDIGVLGLQQRTAEALLTFAVMWLWRDPFAVPLPDVHDGTAAAVVAPALPNAVPVVFADPTQAAIVKERIEGTGGTTKTVDTIAAAAAIDKALEERRG
jgi:hypothetical protein